MNFSDLHENNLIEEAKVNANAFSELYRRYVKKIYNYFCYRTSDIADAEDLTSQTFERVLKNIKSFEVKVSFNAWIFKISRNLLIDFYRKRKIEIEIENVQLSFNKDYLKELDQKETLERLFRQVNKLPDEQRETILLKYKHSFSNQEIAQVLGKSEGAVKQLAHRALKKLKREIKRD